MTNEGTEVIGHVRGRIRRGSLVGVGTLRASPPPYREGLPEFTVSDADLAAMVKELAVLLAQRDDLLSNGYTPVQVVVDADNLPRAIELSPEAVRVAAHEVCNPMKVARDGKRVSARVTADLARLYLFGLEGKWALKPLRGITTSPILKHDGSIRSAQGYDAESNLWCHNIPELNIPERPTEADAMAALRRLRQFFKTFPFADGVRLPDQSGIEVINIECPPGLDESNFLAALLTAAARPSLTLAPAFLCDAPNFSGSGTGKGMLVQAICIIASGSNPSAFTSGHNKEEFDKRLTSALIEARPAVFLDNFNASELKSDILASVLTQSPAMVRIMGQTKMVPLYTKTFVGITGNAVEIAEDMARRILNTHIDAQMEEPEARPFQPGFLDRVSESRSALLSHVLTIWRWGRQTVLKPGRPLGSYELWAQWCRDPLIALGARDPVERVAEIKAADPRRRALVNFFEAWWNIHGDAIIKSSDLDAEIIGLIDNKATRDENNKLRYSRQSVTQFLQRHDKTRVGGYVFKVIKDESRTRAVSYYKLESNKPNNGGSA
jgi:putative DNA primase/helicase